MSPDDNAGLQPPGDLNPRREPVLDFPDRDFGKMTAADYAEIGFMAGLEVHQQLLTRSKLFCRCPSGRYVDHFDAEVLRHMRPTLSELGEYDGTALMEFKTRKEIVYQLERGTVCTYEIDDTPPFEIDSEAIKIALEICRLFNLNLVSELHVMRKQYLDGSIPTGFQRTAMMGLGGAVPFRVPELGVDRELRIRQLSLEEDSCREISDIGHRITFRTDRLGMPLTEVVTEPDLLTPLELQAGGRLIARVTQATHKVRRGPGAARQDVNVSVAGGRRVEIKGVDNHRHLPRLVHIEGFRQLNLLRLRAELLRRGITAEMLALPEEKPVWEASPLVMDASSTLRRCNYAPIRDGLAGEDAAVYERRGLGMYLPRREHISVPGIVAALRLPGFAGTLTHRTQPGVTFAGELGDRVRVIACLTGQPFMIHSDIPGYGLSNAEWGQLRTTLSAGPEDALVVLWGPERDVETAVREVFIRATEALTGIPAETRQAFSDGTTGFERILPGADRMYPDTDTPPVPIPDAWVEEVTANLPPRPWEREDAYMERGLAAPAARRLVESPWADLFDALDPAPGDAARRVANALEKRLPYRLRRRRGSKEKLPPAAHLELWAHELSSGAIRLEAAETALDRLLEHPAGRPQTLLGSFRVRGTEDDELERLVALTADRAAPLAGKPAEAVMRWAMGEVMPPLLGRVDPAEARARLAEALAPVMGGTEHVR